MKDMQTNHSCLDLCLFWKFVVCWVSDFGGEKRRVKTV